MGEGALPPGHAADDDVALVWRDGRLLDIVADRFGAVAWRVAADDAAGRAPGARARPMPVRVLDAVQPCTLAERVERILHDADPLGIRARGSDEYAPEARVIVRDLRLGRSDAEILDLVHATFVQYVDAATAGPRERYADIARQLRAAAHTSQ